LSLKNHCRWRALWSSLRVSDIECYNSYGLVLAIEVKDRELTIDHISDKIANARSKNVSELLFLIHKGIRRKNGQKVSALVKREFAVGQNIYIQSIVEFISNVLILLGEASRREFILEIGRTLDKYESGINHRRAWAELLSSL
jgi:hypothetical protein